MCRSQVSARLTASASADEEPIIELKFSPELIGQSCRAPNKLNYANNVVVADSFEAASNAIGDDAASEKSASNEIIEDNENLRLYEKQQVSNDLAFHEGPQARMPALSSLCVLTSGVVESQQNRSRMEQLPTFAG